VYTTVEANVGLGASTATGYFTVRRAGRYITSASILSSAASSVGPFDGGAFLRTPPDTALVTSWTAYSGFGARVGATTPATSVLLAARQQVFWRWVQSSGQSPNLSGLYTGQWAEIAEVF
jgi:hypothetical protein